VTHLPRLVLREGDDVPSRFGEPLEHSSGGYC
jgi:hypothetical protein